MIEAYNYNETILIKTFVVDEENDLEKIKESIRDMQNNCLFSNFFKINIGSVTIPFTIRKIEIEYNDNILPLVCKSDGPAMAQVKLTIVY